MTPLTMTATALPTLTHALILHADSFFSMADDITYLCQWQHHGMTIPLTIGNRAFFNPSHLASMAAIVNMASKQCLGGSRDLTINTGGPELEHLSKTLPVLAKPNQIR